MRKSYLALLLFMGFVLFLSAGTKLARFPHICGGKIVFVYQGDLWIVSEKGGVARRLTAYPGFESHPRFSPDCKWIAFTGEYGGARNVFVIPAEGGDPVQLTYHSAADTVLDWSPDGSRILFASPRESFVRFFNQFYEVSPKGGFPEKVPIDKGSFASYSPDGSKIVFNRHSGYFWWWKRYKGSANLDLWLFDRKKRTFRKLTRYEGNDAWPMFGRDGKIYFVSDRKGIANIFSYVLSTGKIEQITHHKRDGVQWASISPQRDKIVYENEGNLYVLDLSTGQSRKVEVKAGADLPFDARLIFNPKDYITSYSISPSGKRALFEARGEIFTVPKKYGATRNLTRTSWARDRFPAWSRDGRWIAFISDMDGEYQLYVVPSKGGKARRLTSFPGFKYEPLWSPDSKKILFYTHDNRLYMVEVAEAKVKQIDFNPVSEISDYTWSPDSRFVAYVKREKSGNSDIWIYDVEKGTKRRLLATPVPEFNPRFTPDGLRLIFLSRAELKPNYNFWAETYSVESLVKVVSVDLKEGLENIYEPSPDEEPAGGEKTEKKKKKEAKVEIDWKGIEGRVKVVPVKPGNYTHLEVNENYYFFQEGKTLWGYSIKERKREKLLSGIQGYVLSGNGKWMLVRFGKTDFAIVKAGQKVKSLKGNQLSLADMQMELDRFKEWKQIFDEAWRMVRDYFYAPNLHGVDWKAVKRFYEELLPYVRTRTELNLLLEEMVGELNASHQGARGGDRGFKLPRYNVGYLGARLLPDKKKGLYKFAKIYEPDPLDKAFRCPVYGKVKEGEYLLEIDGMKVTAKDNYYRFLLGKAGKTVALKVSPTGREVDARVVEVKTISSEANLLYRDWVENNRRTVEKLSGGRIGYIHLRDMVYNGLKQFVKWLSYYRYKQGLIIDVRYNGGGGIDPFLIDILERRQYQTVKGRHGVKIERPWGGFYGSVVVMINEYSYSDAEVFPAAFKARKLGELVGVPTLGFVIAVTAYPMIDGGIVRRTSWGLWELSGEMLEGKGVYPDHYVENRPEDVLAGRDRQLIKAVEVLMEKIRKKPRRFDYPTRYYKRR